MTRDLVETWCSTGADELPQRSNGAVQSRADIFTDIDTKLAALSRVADGVYAQWARGLAG